MSYSYSHLRNGPWMQEFKTSAQALESGRANMYDLATHDDDGNPITREPIWIAKIIHKRLSQLISPDVLADTILADAKEHAVAGVGNSGDDLVNQLDTLPPGQLEQLSINIKDLLDWWQDEYSIALVPHAEEIKSYKATDPLDQF